MDWDPEEVTFTAVPGETYYVVWDSDQPLAPLVSNFGFEVSCCVPSICDGVTCGDDGCGGTCGCAAGSACVEGSCVQAAAGDTCETAIDLGTALPIEVTGNNGGAYTDAIDATPECTGPGDYGAGQPDVIYSFTPTSTGSYSVGLKNVASGESPSLLMMTTDCDPSTYASSCLFYEDFYWLINPNPPELVSLTAGTTYFIVVDSFKAEEVGAFTLVITPAGG